MKAENIKCSDFSCHSKC